MEDTFGRKIDYMRISITDRCNLRCRYCMPYGIERVPMKEILSYEETEMIVQAAVACGITKFKITGGEPLVRLGCPELIGRIKAIPGVEQVTLTTNGILLGKYMDELLASGVDAVNVSLDTLDRENYKEITGYDCLEEVQKGIDLALQKKLPLKINSVLQKGVNDTQWKFLTELAKDRPLDVRFIELMPIGYGKKLDPVSGEELLLKLQKEYPGMKRDRNLHGNGPAVYWKIPGFAGSVGFISAVHKKFCQDCNRIRLTAQGELKPCLCYGESIDLRQRMRESDAGLEKKSGADDALQKKEDLLEEIRKAIHEAVKTKPQEHCFETKDKITEEKKMIQIGG